MNQEPQWELLGWGLEGTKSQTQLLPSEFKSRSLARTREETSGVIFIFLPERQREETVCLQVYLPDAHNSQSQAKWKPGAWNSTQASRMSCRDPST